MAALRAEIGRDHRQRRRQIALREHLPVLRVADAEVRDRRRSVFGVAVGGAMNPLASVSGFAALFSTLSVVESGGCCASSIAIDW